MTRRRTTKSDEGQTGPKPDVLSAAEDRVTRERRGDRHATF